MTPILPRGEPAEGRAAQRAVQRDERRVAGTIADRGADSAWRRVQLEVAARRGSRTAPRARAPTRGSRTRSRRSASRTAACRCSEFIGRARCRGRAGRRSGAGTAPPGSAAGWSGSARRPRRALAARRRARRCRRRSAPGCRRRRRSCTPGRRVQPGRPAGQLGRDRGAGQVAQLGQRAGLDRPPVADDADPVAQRLDLGQDVAGQQHGAARRRAPRGCTSLEHRLHQRVEAGGRLVEEQQLDVGGQRGDEGDLLPVALRVGRGPSCVGSRSNRSSSSSRRRGSRPPRSRPSRSITSPPDRLGHSVTSPGT